MKFSSLGVVGEAGYYVKGCIHINEGLWQY